MMSDPIDNAINAEHSRQERAWEEHMARPVGDDELVALGRQLRGYASSYDRLHRDIADDFRRAAQIVEGQRDLQTRLERYREALRPFASHVGKSGEKVTLTIGKDTWTGTLTTDDFESARKALGDTHEG